MIFMVLQVGIVIIFLRVIALMSQKIWILDLLGDITNVSGCHQDKIYYSY